MYGRKSSIIQNLRRLWDLAKQSAEIRWLLLFVAMPLISGSALAWWAWQQREFLFQQGFAGWLLLFILLALPISFSLIPNTLAGLLAGYFLGFCGLAGMVVSFVLASLIGFLFGQKVDSGLKDSIFTIWPGAKKTFQSLEKQSVWVVMLFRLAPAPPFAIGTLLLSWFRIPLPTFLIGSLIGMLPRMAIVVWVGMQAKDMIKLIQHPNQSSEIQLLSFGLLGLVLVGIYFLKSRLKTPQ